MRKMIKKIYVFFKKNGKSIINRELLNIFTTVLISIILQLFCTIIKEKVFQSQEITFDIFWKTINSNSSLLNILEIVLLTLLIWCVTGLAKMLKDNNMDSIKTIKTTLMLILFILGIIIYIFSPVIAVNDTTSLIVIGVFDVILFIALLAYFKKNRFSKDLMDTNHRIG